MTKQDKRKIQDYLRRVRAHSGDRSAGEQQEIVRAVEEHIYETLHAQSVGSAPTDVDTILSEMDPPESFGSAAGQEYTTTQEGRRIPLGILSLIILIGAVTLPFVLMALSELIRGTIGSMANVGICLGVLLLIVALGLGIAARKERAGKATIIASAILLVGMTLVLPVRFGPANEIVSEGEPVRTDAPVQSSTE